MYQVIARKYRPQTFRDVVNQEHVKTTLENAIAQKRIAQGYIFSGQRGTGKTTVARILARCLNCINGPTATPCGECASCREISTGGTVDVIEIDAASNRGINEMRELRENVRYRPARDRYKVFIIDEAHQITNEAFNALLKTLEEPPEWVVFVLCTTESHKIPATIASRCQHFSFRSVDFEALIQRMAWICEQEGIQADNEALAVLAAAGEGSVRDSLSALDQAIACCGTKLDATEVRALLGAFSLESLEQVSQALLESDSRRMLEVLSGAHQDSTVADIAQPADGSYLTLNGDPDDECDLVHHLSASGVADPTFGVGGWVNTTTDMFGPGVRSGIADRIVVQPDGSILLAGTINNGAPTYNDLWVARYTPSGVIDMGFGVNGQAATDLGGADDCAAAAMGPDGKLVVAGYATAASAAMTSASGADNAPLPFGLSHDGEGLVRLLCGRSPLLRGPHTYALTKIVVKRGHVPAKFLCRVNPVSRQCPHARGDDHHQGLQGQEGQPGHPRGAQERKPRSRVRVAQEDDAGQRRVRLEGLRRRPTASHAVGGGLEQTGGDVASRGRHSKRTGGIQVHRCGSSTTSTTGATSSARGGGRLAAARRRSCLRPPQTDRVGRTVERPLPFCRRVCRGFRRAFVQPGRRPGRPASPTGTTSQRPTVFLCAGDGRGVACTRTRLSGGLTTPPPATRYPLFVERPPSPLRIEDSACSLTIPRPTILRCGPHCCWPPASAAAWRRSPTTCRSASSPVSGVPIIERLVRTLDDSRVRAPRRRRGPPGRHHPRLPR